MADAIVRDAARTEADLAAMFGDAAPVTMTDVAAMAHATYAVEASQRVLQKMRQLFVLPVIQGDYAVTGTQYHTLKQLFAR